MISGNGKYRLQDPIFQKGLLSGLEAACDTDGIEGCLVGGGAIQSYTADPALRRSTLDVDVQSLGYARKAQRTEWGVRTAESLKDRGITNTSKKKTRSGAEVRIETGDIPFYVHLDIFTNAYVKEHDPWIQESRERMRDLEVEHGKEGMSYKVQAPEDVAYHKLQRLIQALDTERLSAEDRQVVKLIASGLVDDVNVGDMQERLSEVERLRTMSMEEISREGFSRTRRLYLEHKDQKNLYDVLLLVHGHRESENGLFDEPNIIRRNIAGDTKLLESLKGSPFV